MWYNVQEQEERDYWPASEQQNDYAMSQMEREPEPDDSAKIAALVAAGRFVVVEEGTVFCSRTDGIMGSARFIVADYATRTEADEHVLRVYQATQGYSGDRDYYVRPAVPVTMPVRRPLTDDNIPF